MMRAFHWKVKPGMDMTSAPSIREMRLDDGYSQCMSAGLNTDLKACSVTLSVSREEAAALESFLTEHEDWKAFLWTPSYNYRQIKTTYTKWSSQVDMLRVGFSAEFRQVVN